MQMMSPLASTTDRAAVQDRIDKLTGAPYGNSGLIASSRQRIVGCRARHHGSTIAEMLAALAVIAVGIIGVAALYADGIRTGTLSEPRSRAAELAEFIAQRITDNTAGRIGYVSAIGVVCDPDKRVDSPEDAAAQEAACWEDKVSDSLPSGLGSITRDRSTNPATFVVAVSWSDEVSGAASYVIRVQPKD